MANGDNKSLIENTITLWVARIILPTVIMLFLGLVTWVGKDVIAKTDGLTTLSNAHTLQLNDLNNKTDRIHGFMQLNNKQRDEQLKRMETEQGDHEGRIRTLERSQDQRR